MEQTVKITADFNAVRNTGIKSRHPFLLILQSVMRFAVVFPVFAVLAVLQAPAQEAWTLEQCIRYAYDNNIQLKQQNLQVTAAENNLLQSKLNVLPNLNTSANFNSSKGKTLDNNTFTIIDGATVNSLSGSINSSVSLFKGFQKKNTIDQNGFLLQVQSANLEKLKNDLSLNIALYYLQIIHAQEQLGVALSQLESTGIQVERTASLVEAGSIAEGSLFDIQSQAAREELQVVMARNTLDIAKLNLAQLLDLESGKDFQIVVPDFSGMNIEELGKSVDEVFAVAETILPQVKSAEYQTKSAEKALAVARSLRSPGITLSGGYNTRYSSSATLTTKDEFGNVVHMAYPMWDQLKDGINSSISLGLSIPIFNGWQAGNNIKNAKLNLQNYQYDMQAAKNDLYKEIQQAHADALSSLKKYMSSAKAVTSMEEAFKYAEQRYEVGLMNFVEYSTAKTNFTIAQSELLQAKFEYIFKIKVLDFYDGHPITF
jgi:outer membrane protein